MTSTTEQKERLRLWVQALRSGRYRQGNARLASVDASAEGAPLCYCCLGVACEVAIDNSADGVRRRALPWDGYMFRDDEDVWLPENSELPPPVKDWFGFDLCDPVVSTERAYAGPVYAALANDDLEWTFEKIADEIEAYYGLNDA